METSNQLPGNFKNGRPLLAQPHTKLLVDFLSCLAWSFSCLQTCESRHATPDFITQQPLHLPAYVITL